MTSVPHLPVFFPPESAIEVAVAHEPIGQEAAKAAIGARGVSGQVKGWGGGDDCRNT